MTFNRDDARSFLRVFQIGMAVEAGQISPAQARLEVTRTTSPETTDREATEAPELALAG